MNHSRCSMGGRCHGDSDCRRELRRPHEDRRGKSQGPRNTFASPSHLRPLGIQCTPPEWYLHIPVTMASRIFRRQHRGYVAAGQRGPTGLGSGRVGQCKKDVWLGQSSFLKHPQIASWNNAWLGHGGGFSSPAIMLKPLTSEDGDRQCSDLDSLLNNKNAHEFRCKLFR